MHNWNTHPIPTTTSKDTILACAHPSDNLISTITPWSPTAIVQKCSRSRQARGFVDGVDGVNKG